MLQEEYKLIGQKLYNGMEDGWLCPLVGKEFPLQEADKAHQEVITPTGGAHGRIILSIW